MDIITFPRTIPTRYAAVTIILLLLCPIVLNARVARNWTYKDLFEASDVVAIMEPLNNENNSDQWEWIPKFAQGVTTSFNVHCFLKGDMPTGTTIRVKHFVYKMWPPNGGEMINFAVAPLNISATFTQNGKSEPYDFKNVHPTWLAFLKKMPDGTFAPTSGQIDPVFSFCELHHISMFDPTHGMIH